MPWLNGSMDDAPVYRRNQLLAKMGAERKAEKYLADKAKREASSNSRRR